MFKKLVKTENRPLSSSQIQYYEEYVGSKQFYVDEYEDKKTTDNLFNLCLYLSKRQGTVPCLDKSKAN